MKHPNHHTTVIAGNNHLKLKALSPSPSPSRGSSLSIFIRMLFFNLMMASQWEDGLVSVRGWETRILAIIYSMSWAKCDLWFYWIVLMEDTCAKWQQACWCQRNFQTLHLGCNQCYCHLIFQRANKTNDIKVVVASLSICGVTESGSEGSTLPKILLIRPRVLSQHLAFKVYKKSVPHIFSLSPFLSD